MNPEPNPSTHAPGELPSDLPGALAWDVAVPHCLQVDVGTDDIDDFGHANNVVYLRWLERVAWDHSLALGLGMEEYRRIGAGCVARRHELDYLAPAFAGDRLWLGTWVAENDGRLDMWRAYQIIREQDGRTLMRARTQWVCVDLKLGRPRRQPPEFVQAYRPVPPDPAT
jgi:Predicted thioesterase